MTNLRVKSESRWGWVFDCPVHGIENEVLCFRAFEESNIRHWRYCKITTEYLATTKKQARDHVKGIKRNPFDKHLEDWVTSCSPLQPTTEIATSPCMISWDFARKSP